MFNKNHGHQSIDGMCYRIDPVVLQEGTHVSAVAERKPAIMSRMVQL